MPISQESKRAIRRYTETEIARWFRRSGIGDVRPAKAFHKTT